MLTEVLLHKIDIIELLFPGGSMDLATSVYEEDPISFICNQIVSEAAIELQHQMPTFDCFEIGSGTGGTTSFILPVMNAWKTTYIFTDLSDTFLVKARVRFGQNFPYVSFSFFNASIDAQY
jgi:hypothetical protein